MVDTDQRAVEEIVHQGDALGTRKIIHILERHHDDRPGVPRAAIDAYARELHDREDSSFDTEAFWNVVDELLTDSDSWVDDGDRFYELEGDRISQYPATWHDRLAGERDPAAYLRFFEAEAPSVLGTAPGGRQRADEDQLIDVMTVVGGLSRDSARTAIEAARDDDRIVEDADQHPKAGVYLTE
ncbi:hypothetical protein [Haloarcula salinisoli]|uniref:Uncharacterized protein n=1 Tax=Haloarcula salinisoli TaxID=2487746 RepID=A0A8J7YFQ2_9EURY|nr:hypothetical protein [Halomicroarcula salinisoli]MBX0287698.1 hypothetical protein [Halomicroarcula salinisoli]MBX0304627.1 hypothetical protein [Halomicroarcula salinisoli]